MGALGRLLVPCAVLPGLALLLPVDTSATVPAAPVLTLYRHNGPLEIPYYDLATLLKRGKLSPAGSLAQGSSIIPCLVVKNKKPLVEKNGSPLIGFEIVVDAANASPDSADLFRRLLDERQPMTVANHHCKGDVKHVISLRYFHPLDKAPFFDPPLAPEVKDEANPGLSRLDQIVRAFHESSSCLAVNQNLTRRRRALAAGWEQFTRQNRERFSEIELERARHLDYTMRTALFEGHLDRGCNAYGGCERNVIALTIRNRAKEQCYRYQGCAKQGDYTSVATAVSQYNIWDEYLTQVSGITSCFLKNDLARAAGRDYARLRRMYEQNILDVERILFGEDSDLESIFAGAPLKDVKSLRHYYHPPAMGKCFPGHGGVRYVSGAVARKSGDYVLIANRWIHIERPANKGRGYYFRDFIVETTGDRDEVQIIDNYPGFVVARERVSMPAVSRCVPYGIPPGCAFGEVGRYRRMPYWHRSGKSIEITCRIVDRGENCETSAGSKSISVGSPCDKEMRLVSGVR